MAKGAWDYIDLGVSPYDRAALEGRAFSAHADLPDASASQVRGWQLFNPSSSGVYLLVTDISFRAAGGTNTILLGFHSTALNTASNVPKNMLSSGPATKAATYTEDQVSSVFNQSTAAYELRAGDNTENVKEHFEIPWIIDENNGLLLQGTIATEDFVLSVQYIEVPK